MSAHKPLTELYINDFRWVLAEAVSGGAPLLLRANVTASTDGWVAHPDLPIKLGFAIPLNAVIRDGRAVGVEYVKQQGKKTDKFGIVSHDVKNYKLC